MLRFYHIIRQFETHETNVMATVIRVEIVRIFVCKEDIPSTEIPSGFTKRDINLEILVSKLFRPVIH